ncbi:MAG: ABC transporter substrate-binding protein [Acidobacteria bacterium]|nr:ABC transporter substrate-binding protein [Acidobacteriota bacterium]
MRAEPKTLNPVTAVDAPSRDVLRRLHADLISIDRRSQQTVPSLASSWTVSGNRYTLQLRPGLRFSDGAPFGAADVVFSFAVYQDEKLGAPQRDLLTIDGKPIVVRQTGPLTVEFTLPAPYAAAERLFDSVAMLPRHQLETAWKSGKLRDAWPLTASPSSVAGLGPFRLKQYRPGEAVVLERNPYYWKRSGGETLPYLDGLEFKVLPDEDLQLARFVAGDLDLLSRPSAKAAEFLRAQPGVEFSDLGSSLEYNFLCLNLTPGNPKLKWFGQVAFRQALSRAVDREAMVKLAYRGHATALWGHVSPGNKLWFRTGMPQPARSIAAAREQLRAAGFTWSNEGSLLDAAGSPVAFSILVSASSAERQQMATLLQDDWKALGIAVTVAPAEFRSVLDRVLKTRQFDTCLLGLGGMGDADPNPEMGVWRSSGAMHLWNPGQQQPSLPWEAELDRLMSAQMVTVNHAARKRLYDQVQQIVAREQPMIFLVSPNVLVAQRRVGNFRPAVLDHPALWNVEELYLRPDTKR